MPESEYLLSNVDPETVERFGGLEETFDPVSVGHLRRVGVGPGARCLEIGAGGGSVARWMAAEAGPTGRVLAVDVDPRWFVHDGNPNLEVRQLDVATDPVPDGPWDVIHERLVLQHIPRRLDVLDRLVAGLAPGGWIVVEDFDTGEVRSTDRAGPHHQLIVAVAGAFNRLLGTRGGANDFAANAFRSLRDRGLVDVGASGHVAFASGGTGFARVTAANIRQVRDGLIGAGVAAEDLERFLDVIADPETVMGSSVLVSAWGRRPG